MKLMLFLSIPVSPVYINAPVLFNGKLLPTFVNHTIIVVQNEPPLVLVSPFFYLQKLRSVPLYRY